MDHETQLKKWIRQNHEEVAQFLFEYSDPNIFGGIGPSPYFTQPSGWIQYEQRSIQRSIRGSVLSQYRLLLLVTPTLDLLQYFRSNHVLSVDHNKLCRIPEGTMASTNGVLQTTNIPYMFREEWDTFCNHAKTAMAKKARRLAICLQRLFDIPIIVEIVFHIAYGHHQPPEPNPKPYRHFPEYMGLSWAVISLEFGFQHHFLIDETSRQAYSDIPEANYSKLPHEQLTSPFVLLPFQPYTTLLTEPRTFPWIHTSLFRCPPVRTRVAQMYRGVRVQDPDGNYRPMTYDEKLTRFIESKFQAWSVTLKGRLKRRWDRSKTIPNEAKIRPTIRRTIRRHPCPSFLVADYRLSQLGFRRIGHQGGITRKEYQDQSEIQIQKLFNFYLDYRNKRTTQLLCKFTR